MSPISPTLVYTYVLARKNQCPLGRTQPAPLSCSKRRSRGDDVMASIMHPAACSCACGVYRELFIASSKNVYSEDPCAPCLQQGGGPVELGVTPDNLTPRRRLACQRSPCGAPCHPRLYDHRRRFQTTEGPVICPSPLGVQLGASLSRGRLRGRRESEKGILCCVGSAGGTC